MKLLISMLLAAASCGVLADGVPLITTGPAPGNPASAAKRLGFVKLHPITLNKGAFGANVLTVVVDNKEYRFVGAMTAPWVIPKSAPKQRDQRSWSGTEPGGGTLVLTRDSETGLLMGNMFLLPNRTFQLDTASGSAVLVESDANVVAPLILAPAAPASGSTR